MLDDLLAWQSAQALALHTQLGALEEAQQAVAGKMEAIARAARAAGASFPPGGGPGGGGGFGGIGGMTLSLTESMGNAVRAQLAALRRAGNSASLHSHVSSRLPRPTPEAQPV